MTELAFKKSEIKSDFSKVSLLLYSWPGVGKTTLASHIRHDGKEPLFIATEEGHSALSVYAQKVSSWEQYMKVVDYIIKNKEDVLKKFSTIVLDLVSDVDEMATNFICEKHKVKTLADLQWGSGWQFQAQEFQRGVKPLLDTLPVVFITHCKEREVMYNGERVKIQAPSLQQRCLDYVSGKCDMVGFLMPVNSKNEKPFITFRPSMTCIAKSRFPWMVADFPLDYNNWVGSYAAINEAFKKGATNG